jgi:hypothetical protein
MPRGSLRPAGSAGKNRSYANDISRASKVKSKPAVGTVRVCVAAGDSRAGRGNKIVDDGVPTAERRACIP